jgi:hypothetical protein
MASDLKDQGLNSIWLEVLVPNLFPEGGLTDQQHCRGNQQSGLNLYHKLKKACLVEENLELLDQRSLQGLTGHKSLAQMGYQKTCSHLKVEGEGTQTFGSWES